MVEDGVEGVHGVGGEEAAARVGAQRALGAHRVLRGVDVLVGSAEQRRNQQFTYKGCVELLQR